MLNLTSYEKPTFHFLKEFLNKPFNDTTLTMKCSCYKCHGKGFYHYYDPLLDMQGYYDHDDSEPEKAPCFHCDGGYVIFNFSSRKELTNWIEEKIQRQDWTYDYSDDPDVRRREYFYQTIVQEFLWLLPEDFTKNVLDQHQNKHDKRNITVGLYQTKVPTNCHLQSEYYLSHCN